MILQIDLTPEEEARLSEMARQEGVPPQEYVRRRLFADLNGAEPKEATLPPWPV